MNILFSLGYYFIMILDINFAIFSAPPTEHASHFKNISWTKDFDTCICPTPCIPKKYITDQFSNPLQSVKQCPFFVIIYLTHIYKDFMVKHKMMYTIYSLLSFTILVIVWINDCLATFFRLNTSMYIYLLHRTTCGTYLRL